jgi:hypothetical protein
MHWHWHYTAQTNKIITKCTHNWCSFIAANTNSSIPILSNASIILPIPYMFSSQTYARNVHIIHTTGCRSFCLKHSGRELWLYLGMYSGYVKWWLMLTDLHQKAIWSNHFNNKCKYKILSSGAASVGRRDGGASGCTEGYSNPLITWNIYVKWNCRDCCLKYILMRF